MHYWDSVTHNATDQIIGTPTPKLYYLPMSWLLGDSNEWKWMQFTGLTDKNGKEIYEGDILDADGKNRWVEWNIGGEWSITTKVENGRSFRHLGNYLYDHKCEVIGNIYENPDLLPTHPTSEISD